MFRNIFQPIFRHQVFLNNFCFSFLIVFLDDFNLVAKSEEQSEKNAETEPQESNPPSQEIKTAEKPKPEEKNENSNTKLNHSSKKRRMATWQMGYFKKRKRYTRNSEDLQQGEEKKESSDDLKDVSMNSPLVSRFQNSTSEQDASETTINATSTAPLSINCDESPSKENVELQ